MRYDDILHETFIAAINAILSNPVNAGITQEKVVELAWGVAVTAAGKAKANSTLIAQVRNTLSVPADPVVSGVSSGTELNSINKTEVKTLKPTTVQSANGNFISG